MTEWTAKRFWTEARAEPVEGGFRLVLDGRAVKSPAGRPLVLPSGAMAEAAVAEWDAQGEVIDPRTMPVTRSANSALDQTGPERAGVIAALAAYGETDLLCHRAAEPEGLARQQEEGWGPLLAWSERSLAAPLVVTAGVLPTAQPEASLANLARAVAGHGDFGLTGLYDLVTLSGSLVLGLAVARGEIDAGTGWRLSRIDEAWQIAQWGADEEAEARAAERGRAFAHAARIVAWSGSA